MTKSTTKMLPKKYLLGLYIIIFLPVIGELIRLPFGTETYVLVSDIFIPIYLIIWLIAKLLAKTGFPRSSISTPLLIFTGIGILSLAQALFFLKPTEVAISSLYLARFIQYALLAIVTLDIIKTELAVKKILGALACSATLIALAGFVQLAVYPDLVKLEEYGWDPHINRLVSTWLDPNFVGGLMAFMISILLGISLYTKKTSHKVGLFIINLILATALLLTYSRSAYLALATGIIVIGILKSRKMLLICMLTFFIAIAFSPRAEQRLTDLKSSINSFVFNTAENPDATARLRLKSWQQTLELIQTRPLLGSGYNTLPYIKHNEGFIKDTQVHSASGSDSSLLTILATTGIFGLIPFLIIYWRILKTAFTNWRNQKITPYLQGFNLGMLAATLCLLVHSLFVNSLLFPQILIFLWICVGLLQRPQSKILAGNARRVL